MPVQPALYDPTTGILTITKPDGTTTAPAEPVVILVGATGRAADVRPDGLEIRSATINDTLMKILDKLNDIQLTLALAYGIDPSSGGRQ